jgi:hypothetical protein
MKKLTIYCSILFAFGVLFSAAAQAQITRPDWGKLKNPAVVATDRNFEPQKFTPVSGASRLAYEVWITTDGVLHCRTSLPLKSASINFTNPDVTSKPDANGVSTGVGSSYGHKFDLNKPAGSDAYLFDLVPDKYKEKHAITLTITSTNGSKAEIKLINKKVPAKIEK